MLDKFPDHILQILCKYLTAKDANHLSALNSTFHSLLTRDCIWRPLCQRNDWLSYGPGGSQNILRLPQFHSPLTKPIWRQVYIGVHNLLHNWRQCRYTVSRCLPTPSPCFKRIISFDCDQVHIACCTDDAFVLLWQVDSFLLHSNCPVQCEPPERPVTVKLNFDDRVLVVGTTQSVLILTVTDLTLLCRLDMTPFTAGSADYLLTSTSVPSKLVVLSQNGALKAFALSEEMTPQNTLHCKTFHQEVCCCADYALEQCYFVLIGSWDNSASVWWVEDHCIQLWAHCTGHEESISTLKMCHWPAVYAADQAPKKLLAVGSFDGHLSIWDISHCQKSQQLRRMWAHTEVNDLDCDTEHIITAGSDSNVCVWNWDGVLLHTLKGHDGYVRWVKILHKSTSSTGQNNNAVKNQRFVTGGDERRIIVWPHPSLIKHELDCIGVLHRNPATLSYFITTNSCVAIGNIRSTPSTITLIDFL